jgi:hypothetical protein
MLPWGPFHFLCFPLFQYWEWNDEVRMEVGKHECKKCWVLGWAGWMEGPRDQDPRQQHLRARRGKNPFSPFSLHTILFIKIFYLTLSFYNWSNLLWESHPWLLLLWCQLASAYELRRQSWNEWKVGVPGKHRAHLPSKPMNIFQESGKSVFIAIHRGQKIQSTGLSSTSLRCRGRELRWSLLLTFVGDTRCYKVSPCKVT